MAAVAITTGESLMGWPVTISPPADIAIDTTVTSERGALLLANDTVYVPFGGYCGDFGPYHGWVVGVDKKNSTAPQYYYRTPGTDVHRGSAIWASGGIAADDKGFVYAVTGNSFSAPELDYSNAVLRLNPDLSFSKDPADFFIPSNWVNLNQTDDDLGSSAPLLLPPQKGSKTPNLIFVTGKRGVGHLINRDYLGGVAQGDGISGEGVYSAKIFGRVRSTAVYYEDPSADRPTIFVAGIGGQPDCAISSGVVVLTLDLDENGNNSYHTAWCTETNMNTALSALVTSAPGETGILWVLERGIPRTPETDPVPGVLHAFNAATGEELYNSAQVKEDQLGVTRNFLNFSVIDGRVFVGNAPDHPVDPTNNNLVCYGLR